MLKRTPLLAVVLASALAGCSALPAVGPDYETPKLALPEQWSQPAPKAPTNEQSSDALAQWWRQLGDPQLDRLIDDALQSSLDLRNAQAKLRQSRASRNLAVAGLAPTVGVSGGATRNKNAPSTDQSSAYYTATTINTAYEGAFDANWEIDIFGGTRRSIEAATADQAASAANLENTRVSLVAEVARNYVELRATQQRLNIAQSNLASQTETLQITEWRYQAGLTTALDVEQARTTREQTRASLPDLQSTIAAAENRLAVLTARQPGSLHGELATARPLPTVSARIATGIPADILKRRPDLIAAERTLAAETARVGQKLAARFPSLNLSASFGWQAYTLSALSGNGLAAWALGGTLAATLFDGGRLRSQVEIQNAVQEQALISYESNILTALEEVENALAAHAAAHEQIAARNAAATAAQNAAQLARQQYDAGLADFQKVLDTQRTQLTAEDNLATAQSAVLTSLIQLYKALGGGWNAANDAKQNPENKS